MAIVYVNETLSEIDKATGDKKTQLLKEHGAKPPINMVFSLNFNENVVVDLPEGMPPYKRDEATHPDMFKTTLSREIGRMKYLLKGAREQLPRLKREAMFIQILESIPPKEADVLIFAKDKALTELYPTITRELVEQYFPALCAKKRT